MKHKLLIFCCLAGLLFSCASSKTDTAAAPSLIKVEYKSIAEAKYSAGIEYILNDSSTYVLCRKIIKPSEKFPQNKVNFFIYDLNKKKIVLEESIINSKVFWKNNYQVQVEIIAETLTKNKKDSYILRGYIFDLRTEKKMFF